VAEELLHADTETDGHTDMHNDANSPITQCFVGFLIKHEFSRDILRHPVQCAIVKKGQRKFTYRLFS
jgi:hypothetical protein